MPHIESTSKSHAPKASYSPTSHQPKVADSARGTFESMLDDTAADAKAAVKDANQNAAADRTQQTPAPKAKSDTNASDANKPADQTTPQAAAPDQTQAQTADKPVDPAVVAAQTDAVAATVETDAPTDKADSDKPATDATPAPDAANALPVVPTVPTVPVVPATPVVTAPTPTPADAQPAPTQATEQIAAAAPVVTAVAGQQQVEKSDPAGATVAVDDKGKAVAKDGKDQPATTDQATDGDQVAAQSQQQAPVDGDKAKAPHATLSKTDMEHIARARGESSDKTDPTSGRSQNDQADAGMTTQKADVPTQPMTQTTHQTQTTTAAPAAAHTPTASQVPVAVPLAAVAVSIANKAVAGAREFEIRLDPPELGRIEVRMHVDRDGNVTSRLIADRQDTLDLLKRDSSGLERALQDAGLKTSDNGLQFSLRDQSQSQQQQNDGNGKSNTLFVQDEKLPVVDVPVQNYGRLAGRTSGLDIRV